MGIDAVMIVKCNRDLTDDDLLRYHRAIGGAFKGMVWCGLDENELCVSRNQRYVGGEGLDGESHYVTEHHTMYVSLSCRYYGEGYERGPADRIVALGWFLELLTSDVGGKVYYGGDSGDGLGVFDEAARWEMMEWFVLHQHLPYIQFFDRDKDGPECPLCKTQAVRCGWGGNYAHWFCPSCKRSWTRRDGKTTVTTKEEL